MPQPDGPTRTTNSPSLISIFTSSILYREIQYLDNEYYIENINAGDYNSSRTELVSEISEIIDQINLQSSKQGI